MEGFNMYIKDQPWARSLPRQIDDETLLDLLGICAYAARRSAALEDIYIEDRGDPSEVLWTYVLDALGVPTQGHLKLLTGDVPQFSRECSFNRAWFDTLFYGDFLLDGDECGHVLHCLPDVLRVIREEVMGNNLDRHYK
jgi:hypothetical protein